MPSWGELYDRKMEIGEIAEFHLSGQHDQKDHGKGGGGKPAGVGDINVVVKTNDKNRISPVLKTALLGLAAAGLFVAGAAAAPWIRKEVGRKRDVAIGRVAKISVQKAMVPAEAEYEKRQEKSTAYMAGYLLGRMKRGKRMGTGGGLKAIADVAREDIAVRGTRELLRSPDEEVGKNVRTGVPQQRAASSDIETFKDAVDPLTGFTKAQMIQIIKDMDTVIDEMEPPKDVVEELRGFQAALNERINSL